MADIDTNIDIDERTARGHLQSPRAGAHQASTIGAFIFAISAIHTFIEALFFDRDALARIDDGGGMGTE